jgi:hypothetical protein
LLFREPKSQFKLDDMPSGNKAATECLLYAALLTMAIGRRLLRALQMRHHSTNEPMRVFPLERWAIVMRSVAPQLLALLLGPPHARLAPDRRLWTVLQNEAPDPNRNRMLLLERAQSGVLRHDLVAAYQITDEGILCEPRFVHRRWNSRITWPSRAADLFATNSGGLVRYQ